MAVADKIELRIQELLSRPYRKLIWGDPQEGFIATAPELDGCMTVGESEAEALELLRDAMAGWFESRLVHGQPIPDPTASADAHYSGKILIRTSPRLHRLLTEQAQTQGVSLNQWITTALAIAVGRALATPSETSHPR